MTAIIPNAFRDLTALGGAAFYALLVLLVLLLGEYRLALLLILGFLLTMIIVIGIRLFYFKPRPQKQEYHTFLERIDASSYPSWHTARAFFLALVFIDIYGGVLLTGFSLLVAYLVGYSRVYLRKHDWLDVISGIIFGIVSFWITRTLVNFVM